MNVLMRRKTSLHSTVYIYIYFFLSSVFFFVQTVDIFGYNKAGQRRRWQREEDQWH